MRSSPWSVIVLSLIGCGGATDGQGSVAASVAGVRTTLASLQRARRDPRSPWAQRHAGPG